MTTLINPMRRFGECNFPSMDLSLPAVYQPGRYLDLRWLEGELVLEIDCYSWCQERNLIGAEFDTDKWEAMTLRLVRVSGSSARGFWRNAFQIGRGLINGRSVEIVPGQEFDLMDFLAPFLKDPDLEIAP